MMRMEVRLPEWLVWPGLVLLGAGVGAYGALIGAGGGFILVPILIVLYPELEPAEITAISLGVVWINATSANLAYLRQRRIDFLAGALFASATIPGAVVGALAVRHFEGRAFEVAFAVLLLAVAAWLLLPRPSRIVVTPAPAHYVRRNITDANGFMYAYSFDPVLGMAMGLGVGVLASLFGVGGGIFYVPAMVLLMRFPAYIAVGTSTFVLMFTAATGSIVHAVDGNYADVLARSVAIAAGALIGAQMGARLSERLITHQAIVLRLLSVALILVSLRQLLAALL